MPSKALTSLYHALVHSHLTYCTTIASSTSASNTAKITKAQKKAIRAVCNKPQTAHTQPLFSDLKILDYPKIITSSQMSFMHPIYHGYALPVFQGLWPRNSDMDQRYELRNIDDFVLPKANFSSFRNTPPYSFPSTWNSYGPNKLQRNPITFKLALKEELLSQLSPTTDQTDTP